MLKWKSRGPKLLPKWRTDGYNLAALLPGATIMRCRQTGFLRGLVKYGSKYCNWVTIFAPNILPGCQKARTSTTTGLEGTGTKPMNYIKSRNLWSQTDTVLCFWYLQLGIRPLKAGVSSLQVNSNMSASYITSVTTGFYSFEWFLVSSNIPEFPTCTLNGFVLWNLTPHKKLLLANTNSHHLLQRGSKRSSRLWTTVT